MSDLNRADAAFAALMEYQQADEEGVMVLVSRQAIHEAATAWNTRAAPKVKPLVWDYNKAESEVGFYLIDSGKKDGAVRWYSWALNPDMSDPFYMYTYGEPADDEEAAKDAAQADYERRILSALTPETET